MLSEEKRQEPVTYEPDMQQLTPEHIETIRKASPASSLPDENFTNELFSAQDGWIEWGGGRSPVTSSAAVQVRLRGGDEFCAPQGGHNYEWQHRGRECDIIAYRVIGSEV